MSLLIGIRTNQCRLLTLKITLQIYGACLKCMEMYGNGAKIGIVVIKPSLLLIQRGHFQHIHVYYVEGHGIGVVNLAVQQAEITMCRFLTVTTLLDFALLEVMESNQSGF